MAKLVKAKKKKDSLPDLSLAMKKTIEATKGVDTLFLGDDSTPLVVTDVLSTGLPNLDRVLSLSKDGRWGLPVGKIISVKSKPSVGKTTFLLRIAEQAIKRGGAAHIVESERALEISYARKICPSIDKFQISQPDTLEQAFSIVKTSLAICLKARLMEKNDAPFVILLDSFSGFTTVAEDEGDFTTGGKALGEHARLASLACRKLTGLLAKAKANLILSHQTKSKIGVFWGSSDTNIGGSAFDFHDSICISLYRTAAIKDNKKRIIGHYGIFKTTKNKLYPPHKEVKFKMINGRGFQRNFAILDFLVENGFVKKKGAWFNFKEDKELKWQGSDGFEEFVKNNKKARILIRKYL